MAQHRSHTSVLVSLPQYSDITAAATVSSVSCAAGQADLGSYSAAHVYIVAASTSELIFVEPSQFYVSGGNTFLRNPPSVPFTAYVVTAAYDAAFIVPDWARGMAIYNPNGSDDITARKGTANAFGYTIASYSDFVGDANADGVVGFPIFAGERVSFGAADIKAGDVWHLLAPTASLKAVVNFY